MPFSPRLGSHRLRRSDQSVVWDKSRCRLTTIDFDLLVNVRVLKRDDMAAELAVFILVFATPAWAPMFPNHQLGSNLRASKALVTALTLFTLSEILPLIFLGCVSTGVVTLDYSLKFACFGIPLCVLALLTALVSGIRNAVGIGISSLLSLSAWLFFIMLH
jgi:hypothetical protein